MLRDGPALAIPDRDGETGQVTRLWRKSWRKSSTAASKLNEPDRLQVIRWPSVCRRTRHNQTKAKVKHTFR